MKKTLWLVFLFLLSWQSPAAGTVILVVGDSISAAHGMAVEQGWVQLLQRRLKRSGFACRVINASISGDTTANALRRLPPLLERHAPAVVILEVGGNDGLRGLPLQQMKRNMEAMIDLARQHGAQVLLLGIQLPPNYGRRFTEGFSKVYWQLAASHGIALVPSVVAGIGGNGRLMQGDGIHPNAAAQSTIMELVWPELEKLLAADSAPACGDAAQ